LAESQIETEKVNTEIYGHINININWENLKLLLNIFW